MRVVSLFLLPIRRCMHYSKAEDHPSLHNLGNLVECKPHPASWVEFRFPEQQIG
jgi:hypothetical protein